MSLTLAYGLNVLLNFVECVIVYLMASAFFPRRLRDWQTVLSLLALTAVYVGILLVFSGLKLVQLPLVWAASTLWLRLSFRAGWDKSLLCAIAAYAVLTAADYLFSAAFSLFTGQPVSVLLENPYGYYLFSLLAKIVLLAPVAVLRSIRGKREALEALDWQSCVRAAAIPAILSVVSIVLFRAYLDTPGNAPTFLFSGVLLLAADVATILLLAQMERQARSLRDFAIARHAAQTTRGAVEAWKNAYDEQRRVVHDHQDHLRVVRGLLDTDPAEAGRYLDRLLNRGPAPLVVSGTGRPFADVLFSQKTAAARARGVRLRLELDDLKDLPLPDDELVVLLANLTDNAIEAAAQMPDEARRMVLLRITVTPEASFLYVENPTTEPVRIENGAVRTTKKDAGAHGYGLKNVADLLERRGGSYAMDYDGNTGVFRFSAQIIPQ